MEILIHNLSHSDIVFELKNNINNDDVIMTRPKFSAFKVLTQNIYKHLCKSNNNNHNNDNSSSHSSSADEYIGDDEHNGMERRHNLNFDVNHDVLVENKSNYDHQYCYHNMIKTKLHSRTKNDRQRYV